jgi:hypothetical protein
MPFRLNFNVITFVMLRQQTPGNEVPRAPLSSLVCGAT